MKKKFVYFQQNFHEKLILMFRGAIFCCLCIFSINAYSQSGGDNTYDFLNLTNSARIAALGGQQVSIYDDDIDLIFHNPSLLSDEMNKQMVINYINYFAGVNYGYVAYAWNAGKPYNLAAGIHYINYGEMIRADELGYKHGTFWPADYAFNLYYSRTLIDSILFFGVNVKPLYSDYESYYSLGIASDVGITYHNEKKLFTAAFVIKNAGFQIKRYYPDHNREPLPFEIQIGITKQLQHAPFRFSFLAQQLQAPDLRFKTEQDIEDSIDPLTGEPREEDKLANFADNLMRHVVFGVEFVPTDKFNFRIGYNYKRRVEMRIDETPAMVGFSWGFGIKVRKFRINYGRSSYHISRGTNHFSVAFNLSEFGKAL